MKDLFSGGISISDMDLEYGWHISGRPGSGKTTLLSRAVLDALGERRGMTILSPGGEAVDMVLQAVPPEDSDRIRIIRLGDGDSPVPLSLWSSSDPEEQMLLIRSLCRMLRPENDEEMTRGGQTWENSFSAFAQASIVLFGRRAGFGTIELLASHPQATIRRLRQMDPALADRISVLMRETGRGEREPFVRMRGRLVGFLNSPQLLRLFGTGKNVLTDEDLCPPDAVTLVDLGASVWGDDTAGLLGGVVLLELLARDGREGRNGSGHLVLVDDADMIPAPAISELLQSGNRLGWGTVLTTGRSRELKENLARDLERFCWSFTALSQSPGDAGRAAVLLGAPERADALCQLDAGHGLSVLRTGGRRTAILSSEAEPIAGQADRSICAVRIEVHSRQSLSDPWRDVVPLTRQRAEELLTHMGDLAAISLFDNVRDSEKNTASSSWQPVVPGSWVDKWVHYKLTGAGVEETETRSDERVDAELSDCEFPEEDLWYDETEDSEW